MVTCFLVVQITQRCSYVDIFTLFYYFLSNTRRLLIRCCFLFFFQAEKGIRDYKVTGVQTCALPISYSQMTPSRRPTLQRKFTQLREAGVLLLIGTDSGIPGKFHSQSTWNELDTWVNRLQVDPMTAIRAATYWPAVAMRVSEDYGTITEGKYADIIAVRGDVLRYINLLQDVDLVVKHGTVVKGVQTPRFD